MEPLDDIQTRATHRDHLVRAMQDMYDSEINLQIESFWESGFYAAFGNSYTGLEEIGCYETYQEALERSIDAAVSKYPMSTFAKKYGGVCATEDCPYLTQPSKDKCDDCLDPACT